MDDLSRRSARSGLLNLFTQSTKFVVGMGSAVVLARLLTPEDYGIVGMVAIILNFVVMFQYLGLSAATIQWLEINHRQVSNLFWINVTLSTAIALIMTAAAPLIGWFFHEPRVVPVTVGYAIAVFITGFWIQHEAILTRQMRFGALAIVDLSSMISGISVALIAAWNGAGYWSLVYNLLTVTIVQTIGFWLICKWRPSLPAREPTMKKMITWGAHSTGTNLMNFFSRNMDNILIGRYWGAEQLGLYSRSYQLLLVPIQQFSTPIGSVALPMLSRLVETPEKYRAAYLGLIEKMAMVIMPTVVAMCATSDWLVMLLLGPQWSESARIFMFLGVAAFIQPISKTASWLFSTQMRTAELFRWSLISAAIAVSSICAGLPWGAVGVAAVYAVTDLLIQTPLLFWYVGRSGPVRARDIYAALTPAVCASAATLMVLLASRSWLGEVGTLLPRLALAGAMTVAASVAVFSALPAGRKAMRNIKNLLLLTFTRRKPEPTSVD